MSGEDKDSEDEEKEMELNTNPMMSRNHDRSILKLQESVDEFKPAEYGMFLDARGWHMVEIMEKIDNQMKVKTQKNKIFVVPSKRINILQPEVVQLIKAETDSVASTRDDEVEKKNLDFQLAPSNDISEPLSCCQKCFHCFMCHAPRDDLRSNKFRRNVRRSINFLNLSSRKKALLLDRYVSLVETYEKMRAKYTYAYNSTRSIVTLLNILTPAFVSIQPMWGGEAYTNAMYWTTFATTVISGLITSYISLFKLDKKFYSTTQAYLRLETEGWCYFTLTGKYGKDFENPTVIPTHENRFHKFCSSVEGIRRLEMRVDMVKPRNNGSHASTTGGSQDGTTRRK